MEDWEREKYLLHIRQKSYKNRVSEAMKNIQLATKANPGIWAISFSAGKDSVVMLDLCMKAGWRGPGLFFYYSEYETPPDAFEIVQWAEDKYGIDFHMLKVPGAFDVYERVGRFFITPKTEEEIREMRRNMTEYKKVVNNYVKQQGWVGQFLGMRKAESNQRRKMLGHRGPLYYAKTRGNWTCCPIYRWSGKDIWAYIVENDLPYLMMYDAKGEDRERLRSEYTYLVGDAIWRHGAGSFIKRYNPKVWNYIRAKWPEIGEWV